VNFLELKTKKCGKEEASPNRDEFYTNVVLEEESIMKGS
jgi:hypothetical protein